MGFKTGDCVFALTAWIGGNTLILELNHAGNIGLMHAKLGARIEMVWQCRSGHDKCRRQTFPNSKPEQTVQLK